VTVEIRRGSTRFVERAVGRVTRHSFSFGADYDPARLGFGPMVCHDDHLLGPGRGFDTHRHSGLEIVTWVVSGALRHTDSTGSVTVAPAGSVAVLSTGSGVEHSEFATDDGPCRFVQAWLRAEDGDSAPGYRVSRASASPGHLVPIAQPRPDSVLYLAHLDAGVAIELPAAPRLHAYVVTGALLRSSLAEPLSAGDAFEMTDEAEHTIAAGVPTDVLIWTFHEGPAPIQFESGGGYSFEPRTDADGVENTDEPPVGRLRLMGEHGGDFLWDEEGGIDQSFEYLHRHLGLSRELHADLVRWGTDWDGHANTPEHDARGRALLERLRMECPGYEFELQL